MQVNHGDLRVADATGRPASICVEVAAQLVALQPGELLEVGDALVTGLRPSRISGPFRVDFIALCDGENCVAHSTFPPDVVGVLDALSGQLAIPEPVRERIAVMHRAASECYRLRDVEPVILAAIDLQDLGDAYSARALAIASEWSA